MHFLETLDHFFSTKKIREKWIVIIGSVLILWYVSYILLVPLFKKKMDTLVYKKEHLLNQIETYENALQHTQQKQTKNTSTQKEKATTATLQKKLVLLKEDKAYLDKKFQEVLKRVTNQQEKISLIETLVQAGQESLTIEHLQTKKRKESDHTVQKIVETHLFCQGEYKEIVAFIGTLEESSSLVEVDEVLLKANQKSGNVEGNLTVTLWGVAR
jgi:Tfp pilus assembly protein PilO